MFIQKGTSIPESRVVNLTRVPIITVQQRHQIFLAHLLGRLKINKYIFGAVIFTDHFIN